MFYHQVSRCDKAERKKKLEVIYTARFKFDIYEHLGVSVLLPFLRIDQIKMTVLGHYSGFRNFASVSNQKAQIQVEIEPNQSRIEVDNSPKQR